MYLYRIIIKKTYVAIKLFNIVSFKYFSKVFHNSLKLYLYASENSFYIE